jgi:hypothetical protein
VIPAANDSLVVSMVREARDSLSTLDCDGKSQPERWVI